MTIKQRNILARRDIEIHGVLAAAAPPLPSHSKRTALVTSLVTRLCPCSDLQGHYKTCYKGQCLVSDYKVVIRLVIRSPALRDFAILSGTWPNLWAGGLGQILSAARPNFEGPSASSSLSSPSSPPCRPQTRGLSLIFRYARPVTSAQPYPALSRLPLLRHLALCSARAFLLSLRLHCQPACLNDLAACMPCSSTPACIDCLCPLSAEKDMRCG